MISITTLKISSKSLRGSARGRFSTQCCSTKFVNKNQSFFWMEQLLVKFECQLCSIVILTCVFLVIMVNLQHFFFYQLFLWKTFQKQSYVEMR